MKTETRLRKLDTVLRNNFDDLQKETEARITKKIGSFQKNIKDNATEDISGYIDELFEETENTINSHLKKAKDEMKKAAPELPVRKATESEADFQVRTQEYQEERAKYEEFVAAKASGLSWIGKILSGICLRIKEFFISLWMWIRSRANDIQEKIASFLEWISSTFRGAVSHFN